MLDAFATEAASLGEKLGVILVQLPPSLIFDEAIASKFFVDLAHRIDVPIACEPRHSSWFTDEPDVLMHGHRVARVAADPAVAPGGGDPGGWDGLIYRRLHGAPRIYYSAYGENYVRSLAATMASQHMTDTPQWCIFDNTASGAAAADALMLQAHLIHAK